ETGQHGMLVAAGRAPAAPDVEQERRALELVQGHQPPGLVQHRQRERGRRLADQRRGQRLAVRIAAEPHARGEQRGQCRERDQWHPATEWFHGVAPVAARRSPRKRRSLAATSPPSAISAAPIQIQRTNGLTYTRTAQLPSPSGSPSATYRSRVAPGSIAASVITWPPLA